MMITIKEFFIKNPKILIEQPDLNPFQKIVCCLEQTNNKSGYLEKLYAQFKSNLNDIFKRQYEREMNDLHSDMWNVLNQICELNNETIFTLHGIRENHSIQISHFETLHKNIANILNKQQVQIIDISDNTLFDSNTSKVVSTVITENPDMHNIVSRCFYPAYSIDGNIIQYAQVETYKMNESGSIN